VSTTPFVPEPLSAVPICPDAANEHSTSSPKIVTLGILMSFVVLSSVLWVGIKGVFSGASAAQASGSVVVFDRIASRLRPFARFGYGKRRMRL
jgi:hypothetical protein